MSQYLFKYAKPCVVNTLDFKNSPVEQHTPDRIYLICWKARNRLVTELWYLHKHTMQVFN
jgi:hypothetical protein